MKKIAFLCFISSVLFFNGVIWPQSFWDKAPEYIKQRKSFKRLEWFYKTRAYPEANIPLDKFYDAARTEAAKSRSKSKSFDWQPIGPASLQNGWPSQWGKNSGRVRAIAVHPSNPDIAIIGAASGGMWKTTNGGSTWTDISGSMASSTFGSIAFDPSNPNTVYAGTGETVYSLAINYYYGDGVYKSTDEGATWTKLNITAGPRVQTSKIIVSPFNSNMVYIAFGSGDWDLGNNSNEGIWRSTDAGLTWTKSLNVADPFDILPDPQNVNLIYAAVGGANTNAGIYKSTDAGATFTKTGIGTGLPTSTDIGRLHITISPANTSVLYTVIYNSTTSATVVYKSTNSGMNFSQLAASTKFGGSYDGLKWDDQGWYDLCIAAKPNDPNYVLVGNIELHRSIDGSTFGPVRSASGPYGGIGAWDSPMHVDYHQIVFAPSNPSVIYIGCDGGVSRSTNSGVSWYSLNNQLSTLQFYRIASHPANAAILSGGAQDNGNFRSTSVDPSSPWNFVSTGDGMECFYDYTNGSTVYYSNQYGRLFRSIDGGQTVIEITPSYGTEKRSWIVPFFMHPSNNQILYVAAQGLWKSTNAGSSWTKISASLTTDVITSVAQSAVNTSNFMLVTGYCTNSNSVMVSTDGGVNWTGVQANIPGSQRRISRVVAHPYNANTFFLVRSGFGSGHIYKTTDLGASWTDLTSDLPDVPASDLFIDPMGVDRLFVANDLGIYFSSNGGGSWSKCSDAIPTVPVIDFSYFSYNGTRLLRAATHGRSAYQMDLAQFDKSITLTSPTGGDTMLVGSTRDITWMSRNISNVKIEYALTDSTAWFTIADNVAAATGSYRWTVPDAVSSSCRVRVSDASDAAYADISGSRFIITRLILLSPRGGEKWAIGSTHSILWQSAVIENLKVEVSVDSGATWSVICPSTQASAGSYAWVTPNSPSTACEIRLSDILDLNTTVKSPGYFTIAGLRLISPNGGEQWSYSSIRMITWQGWNVNNVSLQYTTNNGLYWSSIASSVSNSIGSYAWSVPLRPSANCRVRVIDTENSAIADTSDTLFTIFQRSMKVNLTGMMEGLRRADSDSMVPDTIDVYLAAASAPYSLVDSAHICFNEHGNAQAVFTRANAGVYYIILNHRNSIQTWSRAGGDSLIEAADNFYDFSSDSSRAFGNNLVKKGSKWCIYSGDINRDGIIDSVDILLVYNDARDYRVGYLNSDLNGDGIVDLSDLVIVDNSAEDSVTIKKPQPSGSIEMVSMPAGVFNMGDNFSEGSSYELPLHSVTLSAFRIGKTEVTQRQWRETIGSNPEYYTGDNRPVEKISWFAAIDFCNKLSIKEGKLPCYSISGNTSPADWTSGLVECNWAADGYRLPTEAEWEYAARGAGQVIRYAGTNDLSELDNYAWFNINSSVHSHDVVTRKPNSYSLFDINGNVREWCWEWSDYYGSEALTNPKGRSVRYSRAVRGGEYISSYSSCRLACRDSLPPSLKLAGLRLVQGLSTGSVIPNATQLVSPANLSLYCPLQMLLSWNPVDGAESYHLQVSTNSDMSYLFLDVNWLTGTSYQLNNLAYATTYYWRVSANSAAGSSPNSATWQFKTIVPVPAVPGLSAPLYGATEVELNPTLSWNSVNYATLYRVQVSTSSTFSSLLTDYQTASTSYQLSGLSVNTVYYWRVSALNSSGSSVFSSYRYFTTVVTPPCGMLTVTYSGKTYHTVQIGTQCWMKENLNVGTMIQSSSSASNNSTIEKYCYNNNTTNCTTYGGLYTWNEAMQYSTTAGTQGICPTGWHIPTSVEMQALRDQVNLNSNALKAIGQGSGSGAGNNSSGFSALLSGRLYDNFFDAQTYNGYYWTSKLTNTTYSVMLKLNYNDNVIEIYSETKTKGQNVRCLKN